MAQRDELADGHEAEETIDVFDAQGITATPATESPVSWYLTIEGELKDFDREKNLMDYKKRYASFLMISNCQSQVRTTAA